MNAPVRCGGLTFLANCNLLVEWGNGLKIRLLCVFCGKITITQKSTEL